MSTSFSPNLHHQPQFLTVWTQDICSKAILFPSYYLITGSMTARLQSSKAEKTGFTTLARSAVSDVTTWGITVAVNQGFKFVWVLTWNTMSARTLLWIFIIAFPVTDLFNEDKRVFKTCFQKRNINFFKPSKISRSWERTEIKQVQKKQLQTTLPTDPLYLFSASIIP